MQRGVQPGHRKYWECLRTTAVGRREVGATILNPGHQKKATKGIADERDFIWWEARKEGAVQRKNTGILQITISRRGGTAVGG